MGLMVMVTNYVCQMGRWVTSEGYTADRTPNPKHSPPLLIRSHLFTCQMSQKLIEPECGNKKKERLRLLAANSKAALRSMCIVSLSYEVCVFFLSSSSFSSSSSSSSSSDHIFQSRASLRLLRRTLLAKPHLPRWWPIRREFHDPRPFTSL